MSFKFIKEVISPEELVRTYPLPARDVIRKKERDKSIKDIFTGESDRVLVIIGPCSADTEDAVCDYISRLARFRKRYRIKSLSYQEYMNKPRTTGEI